MRKINRSAVSLLLFSIFFSSALWAKDVEQFYVFTDIGTSANTDYSFTSASSPLINNDINYVSYRLGVGYTTPISKLFSLGGEIAYNYYGDEKYTFLNLDQAEIKFSSTDALFVTTLHLNSKWETHLKLGAAYEEAVATEDYVGGNVTQKEWVPEAAAGFGYHFNEHVSIHADFSYLMGWVSGLNDMPDITVGWLGASYAF